MKKIRRITSIMLTMLMLITSIGGLFVQSGSCSEPLSLNDDQRTSIESSYECVSFVENNFSQMTNEYNKQSVEKMWNATGIEGKALVSIVNTDKYGVYLDFNGNNGYMLLTEGYLLYEFETEGDLEYLKGVKQAYYSSFDGFMYKDKTGKLERYDYEDKTSELYASYDVMVEDNVGAVAGQQYSKDGFGGMRFQK